jgi:class 3 adenylate cyclase
VWSASINLASRRDSLVIPDRVQVTEAVVEPLGSSFRAETRGLLDVKGLGPTPTYLLLDRA